MWVARFESKVERDDPFLQKILVLNVEPPPKLCQIDKKYRDPSVSTPKVKPLMNLVKVIIFLKTFAKRQPN